LQLVNSKIYRQTVGQFIPRPPFDEEKYRTESIPWDPNYEEKEIEDESEDDDGSSASSPLKTPPSPQEGQHTDRVLESRGSTESFTVCNLVHKVTNIAIATTHQEATVVKETKEVYVETSA
jgi:hypothetical protein